MEPDVSPLDLLREEGRTTVCPLRWEDRVLHLIDQRLLPAEEVWIACRTAPEAALAIRDMVVRGAPAIGITAAFGLALAAWNHAALGREEALARWRADADHMLRARPTAVNLRWAVERLRAVVAASASLAPEELAQRLEDEAMAIWREDVEANLAMGRFGAELFPREGGVLTHCNAGGLATGGYGTALGVIRAAIGQGKSLRVFADETRPWLQGARLTAYELLKDDIPVTLIVEGASGSLMRRGEIQAVIVGADRIAANGDVANKIGTYVVAELARANGIPFYVAAPTSTLDPETPSGDLIPIEERGAEEVVSVAGRQVAAPGVTVRNPVFDVTPHHLVTAIITERGVLTPPYVASISAALR